MKKQIEDWKIAMIYTIIASSTLFIPFLGFTNNSFSMLLYIRPVLALLVITMFLLGPYIASRIINNFFIIRSVNKIILLSLPYFTIIVFIVLVPMILLNNNDPLGSLPYVFLNYVFYVSIFYLVSRLFIRSNHAENQTDSTY